MLLLQNSIVKRISSVFITFSLCKQKFIFANNSLFFLLNLNFVISTRIAKLAPVLTRQNSIRVQGIFFGEYPEVH